MTLLAPNASRLLRDIEQTILRDLPAPIADLARPATCPETALPWLAWALHIADSEGWAYAKNTEQRRALLANAFATHMRKGTVDSLKSALRNSGFADNISVSEGGIDLIANGAYLADGSVQANRASWAEYSLTADLSETSALNLDTVDQIRAVAHEFSPISRHLQSVAFNIASSDDFPAQTEHSDHAISFADYLDSWPGPRFDGSLLANGSQVAGGDLDPWMFTAAQAVGDEQIIQPTADGGVLANGFQSAGAWPVRMAQDLPMAILSIRKLQANGKHRADGSITASSNLPTWLKD